MSQSPDAGEDTAQDVVAFLTGQHEQIKALMDRVRGNHGSDREDAFLRLRRLLAVHETAEEMIVHPRARRELGDGDPIVTARLHEERAAKQALRELEHLDLDSAEFTAAFDRFRHDVLGHAEAEEREEFVRLTDALEPGQLTRMRRAVQLAEAIAPTRPHPGIELGGEHYLAGPFAAMLDRARDLFTSTPG